MLHPSYTDLMKLANSEVESGEAPVVNSRYSIVLATSKRARQLIDGAEAYVSSKCQKPLSIAVDELNNSKIRILSEEEAAEITARKMMKNKSVVSDQDSGNIGLGGDILSDSDLNESAVDDNTLGNSDLDNEMISISEEV